ncbi:Ig-like domain-containing protein [Sulfurimonas marina]|uniref:Tandem-95 repeat protein n=1 Tax=Sulfurimonas marina TaxID=2590551 RepID=A0A7M1AWC6_9BACT|nr:Ig-like domain-containing protein [Sulfurimonas marina]QOP41725.1 tandem-95 repeat protein [Sulfurimonas marina]
MKHFFLKTSMMSLGTAVVLGMTGCSGGGSSDSTTTLTSISGGAVDGYLQGATVFVDSTADGEQNATEQATITDTNGDFTLTGTITNGTKIYAYGGIDRSTGKPFEGRLSAIYQGKTPILSPLSTYVTAMVAKGVDIDTAKTKVAANFGLSAEDVDKDPMTEPTVFLAAQKVQKTVEVVAAATGESDFNKAYEDVFASLASVTDENTSSGDFNATVLVQKVATDKSVAIDTSVETFLETYVAKVDEIAEQNATTDTLDGIGDVLDTYTEVVESAIENNDTTAIADYTTVIENLDANDTVTQIEDGTYTDPIADALDAIQDAFDNNISYLGANTANNNIIVDLNLTDPATLTDVNLTWSSDNAAVDATTGVITRTDTIDVNVALKATVSKVASDANSTVVTKNQTYNLVVKRNEYAPVALDSVATTNEDNAVEIPLSFSDQNQDILAVQITTQPSHGVAIYANGSITYTPEVNFNGTDSLVYTVTDTTGLAATANVNITVNAVNDAPTVLNDTDSVTTGASVTIDVLANDTDVDSDTLSITAVTVGNYGTATINGGTIDYVAGLVAGTDTLTYTVSDGSVDVNGTVTITVLSTPVDPIDPGDTPTAITFTDGMEFSNFDVWEDYDKTVVELRTHSLNSGTFTENAYELNTTTGVFEASTKANSDYVLGANGWTTESFKTYTLTNGVITFENGMAVQIAAEYDLANPTAEGAALISEINAQVPGEDNVTFNAGAKAYVLAFKPTTDLYELWDAPTVQEQDPVTFNWYSTDVTFTTLYAYMQSVNSPSGVFNELTGEFTGVDFERNTASTQCNMFHNCPVIDSTGTEFSSVVSGMTGNLVVTDHTVIDGPYPQTKVGTWEAKTVNGMLLITYKPDIGSESYFGWEDNLIAVADGAVRKGQYQAAATEFKIDTEQAEFNDVAVNDIKAAIATFIANGGTIDPTPTQLTAVDDSITTQPDTPITYNVLANDFGGEGILSITNATDGQNGTVTWTSDSVEYTPNAGYEGSDSFTYTITDGFTEATATVNVNISTNNPPVANNAAFTMLVGETISGNIGAVDPEGATVTYSVSAINDPSQVFGPNTILSSDGNFTIETVQEGNATITVTMSDGDVNSTVTYSVFVEASMNSDSLYGMSEASQNLTSTEFDTYAASPQTFPADTPLYSFWGVNTDENGTATLEYDYLEFKTDGTFVNPDGNGTHDSQWNSTMTVSMEGTPVAKAVVVNENMSATEIASEITELGELGITLPTGSVVSKVAVLMLNDEYDIWGPVEAYVDGVTPVTALAEMFGNYTAAYNRENYKRQLMFAQGEQFSDGNGTIVEVDMTSVYMGLSMEPTVINPSAGTWTATTYTDNNGTTVDMILMTVDDTLVGAYNKNPILVAPGIVLEDGTTTSRIYQGSYTPANTGFVEYYFNDTAAQEIVSNFNATH